MGSVTTNANVAVGPKLKSILPNRQCQAGGTFRLRCEIPLTSVRQMCYHYPQKTGCGGVKVVSKPLKVFITYSHTDAAAKDELTTRLALLQSEGMIDIWHDNEILPGNRWRDAIFKNLADSDLLFYLVSAASLASENCNRELAKGLTVEIRVIPIILEDCNWSHHELSNFQALPDKGKPITDWEDRSGGWQNVVNGIRKVISEMQSDPLFPKGKNSSKDKEVLVELMFQQGSFLQMLGQINRAIKAYSHVIELNPSDVNTYYNRGIAYNDKGDYDRAILDSSKAIGLNPDFAEAYHNRGVAYGSKDDYNRAIVDYTKAIELKPDYAQVYYNRGNAYLSKDEHDLAIIDYTKAIELDPVFANSYINRGSAYSDKGDFDRAIEDYTKAIELDHNPADAYNNRGVVYGKKEETDRAIEDYTKAIELNPNLDITYYNRGVVWLHSQEWENAKADLTTAKKKGMDIIAAFRNGYKNVEAFEQRHLVKLPEDLAFLLTQRRRSRYPKTRRVLDADGKPLESPNVVNLRAQLRNAGTPLGKYLKTKPSFGINTAPTEAFVVDKATRDKLIAVHPSSADILKPFLHGQDLRRWHVDTQHQWLIFAHRGIAINDYPAILKHLENHRELLRKGKYEWYELQASLGDAERFSQPKLVCPNTYNHQTFAVDTSGYYYGNTSYLIPTEEKWLCGLLNSRTVEWFYSQVSNQLTIDYLRARSAYIQQIPIPDVTLTQKALIGKIVDYLIYLQQQPTINSKDLKHARDRVMLGYFERVIDGLVYEAYLPEELHAGDKHFLQPLLDEQLPAFEEIQGDKMSVCRDIFELLYERTHLVRRNLFFLDSVKLVRIIEGKL